MKIANSDSLDFLLGQVIRLHRARVHKLFGKLGLYRGQPPILFILWEEDGRTQKEIADRLHLKPATITDGLKRMEKVGLIERRPDPEDRRVTRVYLTDKGRELQAQVEEKLRVLNEEAFRGFTQNEKVLLRRFLLQIKDNLLQAIGEDGPC